jgi:hypothetical protein
MPIPQPSQQSPLIENIAGRIISHAAAHFQRTNSFPTARIEKIGSNLDIVEQSLVPAYIPEMRFAMLVYEPM